MLIHLFYRQKLKEAIKSYVLFNQQAPSANFSLEVEKLIMQAIAPLRGGDLRSGKKKRPEPSHHSRGRGRYSPSPHRTPPTSVPLRRNQSSPVDSSHNSYTPQPSPMPRLLKSDQYYHRTLLPVPSPYFMIKPAQSFCNSAQEFQRYNLSRSAENLMGASPSQKTPSQVGFLFPSFLQIPFWISLM
ncbi:hypothetical protein GOP47_0009423 [Adiantum capillus-veneris]|uniref:Uncharacterized protein n=1 Tax=Adiantum capillus-veneris TaxID=13818 RepID=A0A9D4UX28_ADICA|nr:hypothetical protein GOP47_0009423 [Adiantum capillus-veneris]